MFNQRIINYQRIIYLLSTVLTILITACQSHTAVTVTEQWTPPYLQLQLSSGKAQVQWTNDSDRIAVDSESNITIEETLRITVDATEGAQFYMGDGSTLELMRGSTIEMQNPRTFPRLQITLQEGNLLLTAQKPSYEIIVPTCSVTLLTLPTRVRVETQNEMTRIAVEEGAVVCEMGIRTLTLTKCQEMYVRSGKEPEMTKFCDASGTATIIAMTPSPTFDFREHDVTTMTPATTMVTTTPSLAATPTRATQTQIPTSIPPTFTPIPPTDTPLPPPPPKNTPRPTQPPPTNTMPPPPTNTPPPPPTNTPPPPPTNTPPPPTNTPRPTPTPPRPTQPPPTEPTPES